MGYERFVLLVINPSTWKLFFDTQRVSTKERSFLLNNMGAPEKISSDIGMDENCDFSIFNKNHLESFFSYF